MAPEFDLVMKLAGPVAEFGLEQPEGESELVRRLPREVGVMAEENLGRGDGQTASGGDFLEWGCELRMQPAAIADGRVATEEPWFPPARPVPALLGPEFLLDLHVVGKRV